MYQLWYIAYAIINTKEGAQGAFPAYIEAAPRFTKITVIGGRHEFQQIALYDIHNVSQTVLVKAA